jgi:polyvinyl alcohol dehydrogenase (cytochrome)
MRLRIARVLGLTGWIAIAAMSGGPSLSQPAAVSSRTEFGYGIFERSCLNCHGNPKFERAPSPAALREMTPEHIYAVLTTGSMYPVIGNTLSDADRKVVAEMIAGRLMGAGAATPAAVPPAARCNNDPPMGALSPSDWSGWGRDINNSRFQPKPGSKLNSASIARLKLRWAFGYPGSSSAYAQPTVAAGRLFVGTDTGVVYALNANTGCVYWTFQAKSGVRAAASVARLAGVDNVSYGVFFGDLKSNVYGLDAQSGRLLWMSHVEEDITDRVTAAPTLHDGVLYVPISSWEEFAASSPTFSCCRSVGKIVALNARSGATLWSQYVIPERPHPVHKNSQGVEQFAPAGGSVWNSPTIDPETHAVYFGTGDATTAPAAPTTDAVLSLSMSSGQPLWSYQVQANDTFLGGCWGKPMPENCPPANGPDWDIPQSPILLTLPGGARRIVVATKPGDVLALDPDHRGSLLWRMNVSGPLAVPVALGTGVPAYNGMIWGGATDGQNVYYGLSRGGAVAIRAADGKLLWRADLKAPGEQKAQSNATPVSAIPGAVLLGGTDGTLRALASDTGKVLWRFDTARSFRTVNKVAAKGGSIVSAGPVIAQGMVFVGSGYSVLGGTPGNVLLAFAPD